MINFKQEELIESLMEQIKEKFPEVSLIKVMEACNDPESLWIKVTSPEDEDREMELRDFAGDKVSDMFLDYGYHMLVMPIPAWAVSRSR
ncbi:hypothetical protein QUF70_11500 [Desulfobacterales bacterium HSG17]|nr:hypothetical protein [Desulfobacterales bacterium HSG17]